MISRKKKRRFFFEGCEVKILIFGEGCDVEVKKRHIITAAKQQHIIAPAARATATATTTTAAAAAAATRNTMDANENETANGVSECDDDSIIKGIDIEERVVPENGTELLVFEKKDIRSKGAYNESTLLVSSLSRSCYPTYYYDLVGIDSVSFVLLLTSCTLCRK